MRNILTVARYTFLEGVRARFFIAALLVCLAMVVIGAVVASVPYGRVDHLIGRLGWSAVFLTGVAICLFYAITTLAHERDDRILNLLLAKPVSRSQYAIGKFTGFYLLMVLMVLLEGLIVSGMIQFYTYFPRDFWTDYLVPVSILILKCGTLVAFSCFVATVFVTPMVAIAATAAYFVVGAASADILRWAQFAQVPVFEKFAKVLTWLAPQFPIFDLEGWQIYEVTASGNVYGYAFVYFVGYTAIGLVLYLISFQWLELK